ncbi:MAG TPA: methylmalonyl-CoA mutase family protein, partial [Gemmataceae bacterium]|nr:methylmalonyl-CoA mutase family protein [Gemmataceae bacterium]
VDTLDDMEQLFRGIDLARVSVSMTINAPAIVVMACFLANARHQGVPWKDLRGTLQNDILKEFHAQNEIVFPPEPSVRLVADVIEFCAEQVPQWNTVSISGYHIREAGSTAAQELAFTLADGFHYVDTCLARGMDIDVFAPRLSFFFNSHNDMFEEIAKYRAARILWAEALRHKYGARNPASWKLRFHAQTAGCSLQDKQPEVNLIRVAYQALAAALGGCQSLHTNSMDETLALPSEHAATLALRTQQVLAYETGVTNTVDPLGGSYFVETLTRQMQDQARAYFDQIERKGGMIAALEAGFFRREIAEAAFVYQKEVDAKRKLIVGVNAFQESDKKPLEILMVDANAEPEQLAALKKIKETRAKDPVQKALADVRRVAGTRENLMPVLLEAVQIRASVGEIMQALGDVFGRVDGAGKW